MSTPLPNIDFGDINKFEASCGFFLIILSLLSFYFDFDNQHIYLWCKIALCVLGIFLLGYGLYEWRKRQDELDTQLGYDTRLKERQLHEASKAESQKKREEDFNINISEPVHTKISNESDKQDNNNAQNYLDKCQTIENEIVSGFKKLTDSDFEVLTKQKSGIFIYDLILKSKRSDIGDKLIEIKYLSSSISNNAIKNILHTLDIMVSSYKRKINPNTSSAVIIVCPEGADENDIRHQILSKAVGLPSLVGLGVEVIKESKIKDFNYNILTI